MNIQAQPLGKVFTFIQNDKQKDSLAIQNSIDKIVDIIKYRTSIGMHNLKISDRFIKDIGKLKKESPKSPAKVWELIADIISTPFTGKGKPEPLKGDLQRWGGLE
jgi:hypothetical protein